MPDNTKNSLSTALSQFIRLNKNALEIFNRINEAVTSDKENITVDLFDDENNLKRIQLPSFGFLKSEVSRLENDIKNLSGLGDSDTIVKLADGTHRRVITSRLKSPAEDITSLNVPGTFEYKNNWFFEDFMNPLLYVSLDVSNQIPSDTEKVIIKKYLLELDTESKKQYFNENFKGKSDIDFISFNTQLINEGIKFIPDDDYRDLPPREVRYSGTFDIIKISDVSNSTLVDGTQVQTRRKLFKLNKLTFTDLQSGFPDTLSLKVGDSLAVNSTPKDTRYIVKQVDTSTNTVELELTEGYRGLAIGANMLSIYKDVETSIEIQIPINFDKYVVLFCKAVDPVSKIPAENWSPGVAFYTNTLTLSSDVDEPVSLDTYYRNEVTDFGLFLLSMAKDSIPPSALGIKPNVPEVDPAALKVVQVNGHITDNPAFKELKQLSDDRGRLSSQIKELDTAIANKQTSVSTKQYTSTIEKDKDRSELNSLIEQRSSAAKLLASIVADIDAKAKSESITDAKPLYKIRGFFPLPDPQKSKYTGEQAIIGFDIEYRYIGADGGANKVDQFKYLDNGVERIGAQSNWVSVEPRIRERIYDDVAGTYVWEPQDVEDPEKNNINQVDITISQGEGVEMRFRTISEAGYPSNPSKSNWSEVIRVDFPEDLVQADEVSTILDANAKEQQRIKLEEDLASKGVLAHIDDQFTANEKLFKHNSLNIFSGFLSNEQKPITLFDKLTEMVNKIAELEALVKKVKGTISVKILDESGNEYVVQKDNIVKLFAGYYADIVKNLDIKKGAIVAKTYFITIENVAATPLELFSRIYGNRILPAYVSGNKFSPITGPDLSIASDTYYTTRGKYDYVPLLYTNPTVTNETAYNYVNNAPFQSSQLRGQYIYARYLDIAGTEEYYVDYNVDLPATIAPLAPNSLDLSEYRFEGNTYTPAGTSATDFIWNGVSVNGTTNFTGDPTSASDYDATGGNPNRILLHVLHPEAQTNTAAAIDAGRLVTNAKAAKRMAEDVDGKKQTAYYLGYGNGTSVQRTVKCAFDPEDQYTLGKNSVGSYLFISVTDESQLSVNGDDSLSFKTIEFGTNKAVQIPVVFQYRMTDFGGVGDAGIGFIGGDRTGATRDLTYAKKMGFDINIGDNERFSFDIEVFAKYRSNKLNLEKIPSRDIRLALDDVSKNIAITPNITSSSTK
jgi:hypothetical protein